MEVNRSFAGRLYTDLLIPLDGSKVAEESFPVLDPWQSEQKRDEREPDLSRSRTNKTAKVMPDLHKESSPQPA